jgi:serine/threonine protein kinase
MPFHDMTATITCAGCQHAYADTALFCPNCGRPKLREAAVERVVDRLSDPLLGKVLGDRFMVQELLGQGGSGTIYRAEHVTLRRKVAIKVLHNELSRDDLAVERFRREATTVAEIDNEHIVEIHDFGRAPDGRLYLAMELLEGETLDGVLAREKQLSIERVADILIQLGEALMEAHAIGYVHRDLRPRNIYLAVRRGKANFVKLLDFGLAKLVETEGQAASTSLGMTFGDPKYMAPEQARGDRIDRRADIYQLGCVAFEMLTGAPPFDGSRVFDILTKQVTEAPAPLPTRRRGVPLWMEAAVAKMLAKDPENRFATTTRMVEALRRGLETGEVMEDDVARRRESIPPPSVSRVMQRMGIQASEPVPVAPVVAPPVAAPAPIPVPAPPVLPAAVAPAPIVAPAAVAPAPIPVPAPPVLPRPVVPAAVAPAPIVAPVAVAPAPIPVPAPPVLPAVDPSVTMRAPVAPPPVEHKPDSVELLRKRTGTPRVGVPVVPGAMPPDQPPVAGVIDPSDARPLDASHDALHDSAPSVSRESRPVDAQSAAKRRLLQSDPNFSQAWFDEGDDLHGGAAGGDDEPLAKLKRARKAASSPGTTDIGYYDDLPPPRRRWGLLAGIGAFVVIGGTVAFALTRGGPATPAQVAAVTTPAPAAAPIDAAPSTILPSDPAAPVPAAPAPTPAAPTPAPAAPAVTTPPPAAPAPAHLAVATRAPAPAPAPRTASRAPVEPSGGGFPVLGAAEPSRRPGGSPPPALPPAGPTVVDATPRTAPSGPRPPSLTNGPSDPYGAGASEEPPASADGGGSPEKKAEFFANLGSQQLASGDTAGAASNFKKALEIDGKSVAAMTGMGEIAVRQGLFGDAIAHLTKATRMAPKNSRALTSLGEAYLASGNNAQAAANFKKALQIDPDNARARDGYNEASSRVPPPSDDR